MSTKGGESELQKSLKRLTWQYENCLACVWFSPNDPINADLLERGRCVHPDLKKYNLIVSGRDWCNLFKEVAQKHIDVLQERAMKAEEKEGYAHSQAETKELRGNDHFSLQSSITALGALIVKWVMVTCDQWSSLRRPTTLKNTQTI